MEYFIYMCFESNVVTSRLSCTSIISSIWNTSKTLQLNLETVEEPFLTDLKAISVLAFHDTVSVSLETV